MSVENFQETPYPVLYMPYYPLGNLQDMKGISETQYVSAFRQILLGLRHLHERRIAHRDLKPENLLIAEPFTIIIAGFGLSKAVTDSLLTTFCGTHLYAAPEIYHGNSHGYGNKVDIWSTGVIILNFIYGLPTKPKLKRITIQQWSKLWSGILVKKVNDFDEKDLVIEILLHMVRIESEERFTADACLNIGCENGLFRRRDDGHTIHIEDAAEKDAVKVNISEDDATEVDTPEDGTATPTQLENR